eukprot:3697463-Lingulodinium_polyedra.AAC.1
MTSRPSSSTWTTSCSWHRPRRRPRARGGWPRTSWAGRACLSTTWSAPRGLLTPSVWSWTASP